MFPLIYFLLLPLSLLPLRLLYAIGDLLYLLLYYCVGYRKKVVRANLAHSFPEKSGKELKKIERRYFHHLCNLLVEGVMEIPPLNLFQLFPAFFREGVGKIGAHHLFAVADAVI